MHCRVKHTDEYRTARDSGFTKSVAYAVGAYHVLGWEGLKPRCKREVVSSRLAKPDTCPHCGRVPVQVFNKSGRYLDDDSDYEWTCRACHCEKLKPKRTYVRPGDKLKPWSELKRRGKVARILKDLPRPTSCQHCDKIDVELVSRSGTWLEDLADYAWVCRHHAYMIEALRPEPKPIIIDWPRELFPWLYYNSMSGTFEGHSILNRNSAGGRFLAFEPPSLKKHLLL
jgi:hypothetical protein